MRKKVLQKEAFIKIVKSLNHMVYDYDFLYELYSYVIDAIYQVMDTTEQNFAPVNHYVVILYLLNEYSYSFSLIKEEKRDQLKESDEFFNIVASMCADKYLTNEQLNYKSNAFLNRFNVPVSTLDLYLNFILRSLSTNQPQNKPDQLIKDMLTKGFSMAKCILSLLINGFETEAFSTWRTLHENECIILCLIQNGEEMFKEYYKHITFALAYRGQIPSKEETNNVFVQIKSEMKAHDLKSKDMKKFIEYGYLYVAKNLDELPNFKLNFRDGVEAVAGLSNYSKVYEMASEIAHSSPLLLYSNKSYFFEITMLNLYESFMRLEKVFEAYYRSIISKDLYDKYVQLKSMYMAQLQSIYVVFRKNFFNRYNVNDKEN